jgi:hypothetical protein
MCQITFLAFKWVGVDLQSNLGSSIIFFISASNVENGDTFISFNNS